MIFGIQGGIGAGKTLLMTRYAYLENTQLQRPLLSNYSLKSLPYIPIKLVDVIRMMKERARMERGCFLIDEAHIWFDARISSSVGNRLFSYFALQTGKLDINLYYTTQAFEQVDWRLTDRTDVAITVKAIGEGIHQLFIWDRIENKTQKVLIDLRPWWNHYDTKELIDMDQREEDLLQALRPSAARKRPEPSL